MEIDADSAKQGLKTAVAEMHDPSKSPADEPEQIPLLPLEGAGIHAPEGAAPRGPGRPPGSRNKSTDEWRKFLLSKYRSPLEALAQTFNMPIEELAKRLGLKNPPTFDQAVELFKVQITAAKELAPYVHQKMPQAIEAGEGGLIQLVINQGNAAAQGVKDASGEAFKILNMPYEENQLVTDADFTESNNSHSNESE